MHRRPTVAMLELARVESGLAVDPRNPSWRQELHVLTLEALRAEDSRRPLL